MRPENPEMIVESENALGNVILMVVVPILYVVSLLAAAAFLVLIAVFWFLVEPLLRMAGILKQNEDSNTAHTRPR
jgi:hypothetical protein